MINLIHYSEQSISAIPSSSMDLPISLLDLTFMEYELLKFFVENQDNVWSREQLLEKVWGYDYFGGARTVDVHVRRLRAKLGDKRQDWIKTVHSVGYKFN